MLSHAAKYFLPIGATAICMPAVVFAGDKRSSPGCVYDEPKKVCGCPAPEPEVECKETELERLVMKCRQDMVPVKENMGSFAGGALQSVKDAYGTVMENVCYLRTKAPEELRIGTVVAGGLVGMLFGIRGGRARKLLYGSLGAAGASYVAYPKETVYYAKNAVPIVQKYSAIAYNFVVGGGNSQDNKKCGPAATVNAEKQAKNIRSS